MIGTNYVLSVRMKLSGDLDGLAPEDSIIRIVMRYRDGSINDSVSRAFVFSDFPPMADSVVELSVRCFRIDTTIAETPMRYRLRDLGDTLAPSYMRSDSLTKDTARHYSGFDIEIWNHAHAGFQIDQINVSDYYGYALYVGDDLCLPQHRRAAGAAGTPYDSLIVARLRNLVDETDSTLRFLELPELGVEAGCMPVMNTINRRIGVLSNQRSHTVFFHTKYYALYNGTDEDNLKQDMMMTEPGDVWSGLYSYTAEYGMTRPKRAADNSPDDVRDSAYYYNNYFLTNALGYRDLSKYYLANAQERKKYGVNWMPAIGNHTWMFGQGMVREPGYVIRENREPSAAEVRLQANLALCYGARGVMYYGYNSFPGRNYDSGGRTPGIPPTRADSTGIDEMGQVGFLNYNLSRRTEDIHGESKWDSAAAFNLDLKMLGDSLYALNWDDAFSYDEKTSHHSLSFGPLSWIVTQRLGIDADGAYGQRLVEVGIYKSPVATDTTEYWLFVVNKRTDECGGRHITVKLKAGWSYTELWKVTNVETEDVWFVWPLGNVEDNDKGGFTDYFAPGQGNLYRLEKVTNNDGQISGCYGGNVTFTRGIEDNFSDIALRFQDTTKFLRINGRITFTNSTFSHCTNHVDVGTWGGIVASGPEAYLNFDGCTIDGARTVTADASLYNWVSSSSILRSEVGLLALRELHSGHNQFFSSTYPIVIDGGSGHVVDSCRIRQWGGLVDTAIIVRNADAIVHGTRVDTARVAMKLENALVTGKLTDNFPDYFGWNKFTHLIGGIAGSNSTLYFGDDTYSGEYGSYNTVLLRDSSQGTNYYAAARDTSDFMCVRNYWGTPLPDASLFIIEKGSALAWQPCLGSDPVPAVPIFVSDPADDGNLPGPDRGKLNNRFGFAKAAADTGWRTLMKMVFRGDTSGALTHIVQRLTQNIASRPALNVWRWLASLALKMDYPVFTDALIDKLENQSNPEAQIVLADLFMGKSRLEEAHSVVLPLRNHTNRNLAMEALIRSVLLYVRDKGDFGNAWRDMDTLSSRYGWDPFVRSLRLSLPHMMMGNFQASAKRVEDKFWDSVRTTEPAIAFSMSQNYPNPFNPATSIRFTVPWNAHVRIEIFDMLGRKVDIAAEREFVAGSHIVVWQARSFPSGIYFYRLYADPTDGSEDKSATGKMIVMK